MQLGKIPGEKVASLSEHNAFHTSGSANLNISPSSMAFIRDHLISIENGETIKLFFNSHKCPNVLKSTAGFIKLEEYKDGCIIEFDHISDMVVNIDAISTMNSVKDLLKTKDNPSRTPTEFYAEMMACLLEISIPYSSFVEMLFANMFVTKYDSKNKKNCEFWRYNQDKKIIKKFGDKNIAYNISPLLGLLYQPNVKTLEESAELDSLDVNKDKNLNIYERIWLGVFD